MNMGMLDWLLIALAAGLLVTGLYFRETRLAIAIVLLLGGIALNTTAFLGFIGVPMILAAGVLLYAEYMQRPRPAMASGPEEPTAGEPPPQRPHEPTRQLPPDDIGPADD